MSLNRVNIIGNLGANPEIKTTGSYTLCTFSVATNESYGTLDERKQHTEWHHVVVFGKLAQTCCLYLRKGSRIFLEGRLRTSTYNDKEGKKQSRTRIYSSSVKFLDGVKVSDASHLPTVEAEDESMSVMESSILDLA